MSTVETLLIKEAANNLYQQAGILGPERPQVADMVMHYLEQQIAVATSSRMSSTPEPGWQVKTEDLEELNRLRTSIMRGRTFTDDSAEILEEARNERTAEL